MTKKRKSESFIKRLSKLVPSFYMEADGRRGYISLSISGIRSVSEFSDESVVLKASGEIIRIRGEYLNITVFESKRAEITGIIEGIEFEILKKGKGGISP